MSVINVVKIEQVSHISSVSLCVFAFNLLAKLALKALNEHCKLRNGGVHGTLCDTDSMYLQK
jgi:hypothetical protein